MPAPIRRVILASESGNLDGVNSGDTIAGAAIRTAQFFHGTAQALFEFTIATGSLALAPKWQVSDDGSTWHDLREGAGGAPTTVTATATEVLLCPDGAQGWPFCRPAFEVAGANAGASDLYSITPRYIKRQTFSQLD